MMNSHLCRAAILLGLAVMGCSNSDPGQLTGTVKDSRTGAPLGNALVAIEVGGIYMTTPDAAKGNPSYQIGTITAADGTFAVSTPGGKVGLHSFTNGYFYGSKEVEVSGDTSVTIEAEPSANPDKKPKVSELKLEPAQVAPGAAVTLTVKVEKASESAPLSEEVLVLAPWASWSAALDPPSAGTPGVSYPDGIYRKVVTAPSTPGTYTYHLAVTTETCVNADVQRIDLVVK